MNAEIESEIKKRVQEVVQEKLLNLGMLPSSAGTEEITKNLYRP